MTSQGFIRRAAGRGRPGAGLTATAAAVLAAGALCGAAAPAGGAGGTGGRIDPSTRADLLEAMRGEAYAYAAYRAYAVQAGREGLPQVRTLYEDIAETELREHFAEQAELAGLVGDNAANLRDAMSGESYEAATMYRRFATEAKTDGDFAAANRFSEIAKDESRHHDDFAEALRAVTDPSSGAVVPAGQAAESKGVPAGPPRADRERTLRNLRTAMEGEAFAHAKYDLYAEQARKTGQPALARLFDRTARVELAEHFAEEGRLAGLVRDTRTNLCTTIRGETEEGTHLYLGFARRAAQAGDQAAAKRFEKTASDELRHARRFRRALDALGGTCPGAG
ncbi:ferritin family protein [Planomonospora corallina]|uniref:Ferritin family protein n=1 Tax=Planomonospora corallina TaxID=1806052 RepID=A0ABV8IC03_9ACTN